MCTVVNIKKKELIKNNYLDFIDWHKHTNHIYIGRNMSFYVPGTEQSIWANPFSVKKYGRAECLKLYREYVCKNPHLWTKLPELKDKVLGCWCHPEPCHGHVLQELVKLYYSGKLLVTVPIYATL